MLYDLASAFPTDAHGIAHPSAGLPNVIRQTLAQKFGHLGAATDRHPIKSAARLGIELRPYQHGDKLQALSMRTLVRTERLESRVDESPGRQHVLIAMHTYENMNFANEHASANKTQVALAAAAIIERLHINQSHSTTMHYINSPLFEQNVRQTKSLSRYQSVYLISDFLNRDRLLGLEVEAIHEIMGHARVSMVVVRDPYEWFDDSSLPNASLLDFRQTDLEPSGHMRTMGEVYRAQLHEHYQLLTQQAQGIGASLLWTHGKKSVATFCDELSSMHAPRHRMANIL